MAFLKRCALFRTWALLKKQGSVFWIGSFLLLVVANFFLVQIFFFSADDFADSWHCNQKGMPALAEVSELRKKMLAFNKEFKTSGFSVRVIKNVATAGNIEIVARAPNEVSLLRFIQACEQWQPNFFRMRLFSLEKTAPSQGDGDSTKIFLGTFVFSPQAPS